MDRVSGGVGGKLALGSLSSAPGDTCPNVPVIPSRGPPPSSGFPAPCGRHSAISSPHTPALADPRASKDHQLFSCCLSAFSLLVPRKVGGDKSPLGLLPPADREQAGAWVMGARPRPAGPRASEEHPWRPARLLLLLNP